MEWSKVGSGVDDSLSSSKVRIVLYLVAQKGIDDINVEWSDLPPQSVVTDLSMRTVVRVDSSDDALRLKTTAWNQVVGLGNTYDRNSVLLVNENAHVTETGIANIAIQNSSGHWITPPLSDGLLPGTLRSLLIEKGLIRTDSIHMNDIQHDTKILCFNSLRGFWFARIS
jgi:branched-subunit amino acid aminotransferase/4-amino-4-deoxychorismate lyase